MRIWDWSALRCLKLLRLVSMLLVMNLIFHNNGPYSELQAMGKPFLGMLGSYLSMCMYEFFAWTLFLPFLFNSRNCMILFFFGLINLFLTYLICLIVCMLPAFNFFELIILVIMFFFMCMFVLCYVFGDRSYLLATGRGKQVGWICYFGFEIPPNSFHPNATWMFFFLYLVLKDNNIRRHCCQYLIIFWVL